MRFMMLMIPNAYRGGKTDPNFRPDAEAVAAMTRFNQELSKAGILLALDGLHPPASGARVGFSAGKAKLLDGPFAEAKEVLGGYWMLQVKSRDEAIAWALRVPAADGDIVEVRQVFEMSEFPPDVQKAAGAASKSEK
ncbi:MAG: YciI family protein [Gemmatimonadales bacterium]